MKIQRLRVENKFKDQLQRHDWLIVTVPKSDEMKMFFVVDPFVIIISASFIFYFVLHVCYLIKLM